MQFYLSGVNPLFWKQVEVQPRGIYNLTTQQTTSAAIDQLFVAFVQRPVGTLVDIYVAIDGGNFNPVGQAKIVDNSGFIYSRFSLPYTNNLDNIEVMIRENGTNAVLANEGFSSSHIDFMYEVQGAAFLDAYTRIQQFEEDGSIVGVDETLLHGKYGVFTGLTRRTNQSANEYRAQTACLWRAFQYAGTEKGLNDAIECIVGSTDSRIDITPTRETIGNEIFVQPQIGPTGPLSTDPSFYTDQSVPVPLIALDHADVPPTATIHPHYYAPGVTGEFNVDTSVPSNRLSILAPLPTGSATAFNADNVSVFALHSPEAIANEVVVEVQAVTGLDTFIQGGQSAVTGEGVIRLVGVDNDQLANGLVTTTVRVTSYYTSPTGSIIVTPPPVEGTDFVVDHLTGTITWATTGIRPVDNRMYTVDYSYRLDDAISIVVKQVKPAHKKVLIGFGVSTFNLPPTVEA